MKKSRTASWCCILLLLLAISGCKLSIISITGPSGAHPGQTIVVYVKGTVTAEDDTDVSQYGLILQLPVNWEVLSAKAMVLTERLFYWDLTETKEYEGLYTPEPEHKIWVGTAQNRSNMDHNITIRVEIMVGNATGQFQIKGAVGAYRNDAWTTEDPGGEFSFSNITAAKYISDISVVQGYGLGSWQEQYKQQSYQIVRGVWGSSANDVFSVGYEGTILHYDGTSWNAMTSGTGYSLDAVWGSSANDVFAVGGGGTILHYDGTSWNAMTSGTTTDLYGVWGNSAGDVFAVGRSGTILHYDGTSWNNMESGTTASLCGVWGSSSNDVFAVGFNGPILGRLNQEQPFVQDLDHGNVKQVLDNTNFKDVLCGSKK